MQQFRRWLSDEFVAALNTLHASPDGAWWKGLLDDSDIFVAIRENALNAYYRGCSLAEIKFDGREVRAHTHYKYLLRPATSSPYIEARSGKFQFPDAWRQGPESIFIHDLSDIGTLKLAAKPYAGGEKTLVGRVVKRLDNVLDVEIALAEMPEAEEERAAAPRIDLAALRWGKDGLELAMYEAKLFANKELRASGDEVPVLDQIATYDKLLTQHRDGLRESYVRSSQNLIDLRGIPEKRKRLAEKIIADPSTFSISPLTSLIVGGFDADQKKGPVWTAHLKKLQNKLGKDRVFAAGSAENLRLPGHGHLD